jgi:hypothetical protein
MLTDLSAGTAGSVAVAGALAMVAIAVLGATNRFGASRTGGATGIAKTFMMGGVTETLDASNPRRKNRVAEGGAGVAVGQSQTGKQAAQAHASQDASEPPEDLTARGRGRNGFGKRVKLVGIHGGVFLSSGTGSMCLC